MISIDNLFLDGTKISPLGHVCEFSPNHATPVLSWAVSGGNPDDRQVSYTLTVEIDDEIVYDSGYVETSRQSALLDGFTFPAATYATVTVTVPAEAELKPVMVMLGLSRFTISKVPLSLAIFTRPLEISRVSPTK